MSLNQKLNHFINTHILAEADGIPVSNGCYRKNENLVTTNRNFPTIQYILLTLF